MANEPTRILVRQVMGVVAQYEKSQIVLKLRGARMRKRAKEGSCKGRKPYGYYEGEAAALERLKALRSGGLRGQGREAEETISPACTAFNRKHDRTGERCRTYAVSHGDSVQKKGGMPKH